MYVLLQTFLCGSLNHLSGEEQVLKAPVKKMKDLTGCNLHMDSVLNPSSVLTEAFNLWVSTPAACWGFACFSLHPFFD